MKLARVNLEAEVWGDPRFPHLERLLGYPPCSGHLAIARMAMIWGWQVEHYTPEVPCFHAPEEVIEMALEVDGPVAIAALVRARLAELTPDGVRMKGSSHEATGWLWRIRQKSVAGVEAKRKRRDQRANGKHDDISQPVVDPWFTTGQPQVNPLSSGLSVPEISDLTHTASGGGSVAQPTGRDRFVQLAASALTRVDHALRDLMAELGQPLFPKPRRSGLEVEQMAVAAVAGWAMSEPERDPSVVVAERLNHLIAVRSASARERRSATWWAASTFWDPSHIERDLMQNPSDAARSARGRDGPGGGRAIGRAPPATVHSTETWDPKTITPRPP